MESFTYPKASLLPITCPHCKVQKPEHAGYRLRKLRDISGIRQVKVMKVRCRECLKLLCCIYPPEVPRAKWYSHKVEGLFAILDLHQVDEACADEIAEHLGYTLKAETRAAWQAVRSWRAERLESDYQGELGIVSIDEFKVGSWWVYTLTDVASQAVVAYEVSEQRSEERVRDLIAEHNPAGLISDGCKAIEAAAQWFADLPHGRCWFHVIKDVLKNFARPERKAMAHMLRCLYEQDSLEDAEHFLNFLVQKHGEKLTPLLKAWSGLKQIWLVPEMPLTNNASENLYHGVWKRERKRVVKALDRLMDWLGETFWRWNHHLIDGKTPWQRLSHQPSPCWLSSLITPLGRSYDF